MRKDITLVLEENNVKVQLKAYKEIPTDDGYHMVGNLYVNGKKAISFEDGGFGGGCDHYILNQANAQPILDILPQLAKIKAYPDSDLDCTYDLETMFYEMAEDFLANRDLKRQCSKKTLVKFLDREYSKGEYTVYTHKFDKPMVEHIIKELVSTKQDSVVVFNIDKEWKEYTVNELLQNVA
jgi:hypothetical protein